MNSISDKKISVFINNAGFGLCGSFLETDEQKELMIKNMSLYYDTDSSDSESSEEV